MYLDHFSLQRPPYRITPDPALFFPGGEHGRGVVLEALIYGITTGEGILKVVGEVGSGKTMLCRMLEEKLPAAVEIVYLANPSLSARDIVYAIAFELKLEVDAATDRLVAMQRLQDYLLEKHSHGGSVVVFIEEAQSMPLETLEEIRLLSNLETHHHKLMQIVLFGQPELDKKLAQKSIRQLKERITHSFNLDPLSVEATREYLRFRLQAAGCPWPQLFSPKAESMIAKASSGLTRRINILADKSLLAAYADTSMRTESRDAQGKIQAMVLPRHVKAAIKDSDYASNYAWLGYAGMALIVMGVGLLFYMLAANLLPLLEERKYQIAESAIAQNQQVINEQQEELSLAEVQSIFVRESVQERGGESEGIDQGFVDTFQEDPIDAAEISIVSANSGSGQQTSFGAAVNETAVLELVSSVQLNDRDEASLVVTQDNDLESSRDSRSFVEGEEFQELNEAEVVEEQVSAEEESEVRLESVNIVGGEQLPPLLERRSRAATGWLQQLPASGYTVQLYSAPQSNPQRVETFLQELQNNGDLERTYLCWLSGNEQREPTWLVFYGEFQGVTPARDFINRQPEQVKQYFPYVRNLNEVACVNE